MVYEDPYDRQQARIQALQARVEALEKALQDLMDAVEDELTGKPKNVPKSHWATQWEAACELLGQGETTHNKNA